MADATALPPAIWTMRMANETPGAEEGEIILYLMHNGNLVPSFKFDSAGIAVKNAEGGWVNLMTTFETSKLLSTE